MTSRHGVHVKDQVNLRLDPDLLARLRAGAKRHGQTMTAIVERGAAAELDRLDGIATATGGYTQPEPAPVIAAEVEEPEPARKNCKHANMRMSKGVCPDCKDWVVKK